MPYLFSDILVVEMIPRILDHVCSCLSSNVDLMAPEFIESKSESQFWLNLMEATKDQYAVERMSEELLRQLATKNVSDVEAYWMLWLVFGQTFKQKAAMR